MPSDFLELLAAHSGEEADSDPASTPAQTPDERVRRVLFECLFAGLSDDRVASLFAILGWSGEFSCYVIAGYPAHSAARSCRKIAQIVADFGGSCLTTEHHNADGSSTVTALIRTMAAANPELICNTVASLFDAERPLALSRQLAGPSGAMHAIRQTQFSLRAAPALAATVQRIPRPLRADDALPERALLGDDDARSTLVHAVYDSLAAGGPEDPTLLTVSTFLKFGGSLESTAKELNVHPNTIRYRLKRAAESTGWDATDPREAYVLTTAIALGRIAE